ncbi:MAG: asparagine synthase (glutamine-hydrolyzing) [Rhizobacter sp.]|nr:asparagine synthase (glutamine-hydrolyzing) [Rhizobacter sp.]
MCGIAGLVGRIADPNRAALRRMNDAMAHRGPDGDGYWEAPADASGWGPMFAHRRLSILDLSTAASQPMVDPVTGHAVVLNGEIYNYVDLRAELSAQGHTLQSSGDTAAMLRALGVRGREAIASLRGMFAFGHWDPNRQQLTLARDPLGIKPLYFARNPDADGEWAIVFASEVRAILASGLLGTPRLNPLATASVVWNGFTVAPHTAIAGVETLWPGEYLVLDSRGKALERRRYYALPPNTNDASLSEDELAQVLEDSVRLHLASDVPLGVFLSGGVDSSAVANLAQKTSTTPVHTFTLAFAEQEHNEGEFSRQIARAIGTQHQEFVLTEDYFLSHLDTALDSLDQPTFDGLNSYFMSKAVRDAGFTVALIGSGGDELFGGYTSFRDLPSLNAWSQRGRFVPMGLRVALARLVAHLKQPSGQSPFGQQTRWAKLPDMVARGDDLLALYQMAYALFLPATQGQLLGAQAQGGLVDGLSAAMHERLGAESQGRSPLAAISAMEQRIFLGERLLRDTDAASMAASIETRLPLVDQVLLENVYRLPDAVRFQPQKALLRRVGLRGLDPALFDRPKTGFVLPYDRWLRNSLGKRIDATMRDADAVRRTGLDPAAVSRLWKAFQAGAPGLYWSRVWAIYVYIRWCHRHGAFL